MSLCSLSKCCVNAACCCVVSHFNMSFADISYSIVVLHMFEQ